MQKKADVVRGNGEREGMEGQKGWENRNNRRWVGSKAEGKEDKQ